MDDIKKILIYRTDRFGDFLISSPFIKNLKLKFPNSKIDAIYQIPESAREEVWVDKFERPVSILFVSYCLQ